MQNKSKLLVSLVFITCAALSCHNFRPGDPSKEALAALDLKKGTVVLCGPPDKEFGQVDFKTSCPANTQKDFNLGLALLHSFEYDEAEKVFANIIEEYPRCAMAYWGVAMSNYHQVWPTQPTPAELEKGAGAIAIAETLPAGTDMEKDYVRSMATFYTDWQTASHRQRSQQFLQAMENMYKAYPAEKEVAIFYALALVGAANPADKSYVNQKKAGDILNGIYPGAPNHPGVVHYIIHSYDNPGLAALALPAARQYASIAPSSAHAQHMPSHIFTRLGLWDESIHSNLVSTESARCYAESAGIKGHWDEELHGMDYLVYAYLQQGREDLARGQLDYLNTIDQVYPENFKVAYAFAAIPARFYLETRQWKEAASLSLHPSGFPWEKFPWQEAIIHYARLMGLAQYEQPDKAQIELSRLQELHDSLAARGDPYKANQVQIQIKSGEAWILLAKHRNEQALLAMKEASDLEDQTEKSPVTPGEVLPARELLGDMLLKLKRPAEALVAYEESIRTHPNRLNGTWGAARASEESGNADKAAGYYRQVLSIVGDNNTSLSALVKARAYLHIN